MTDENKPAPQTLAPEGIDPSGGYGEGARLYKSGPWEAGLPTQGYQLALTPAQLYRRAIPAIEDEARRADEIHVAGYTDGIGSEAVNAGLARARAEAIQSLLVKRGIPPERIFVSWHGAGRYLADNATEQGRAMNRRVEVLFVRSSRGGQDRERYSAR